MSRTNKNTSGGSKNPCAKFLSWKSNDKGWNYWDKTNEKEVVVAASDLVFIVLDQLNTIKGFDEKSMSGIWANEVRSVGRDKLTVNNKNGTIIEGLYKDIKGKHDGKFTKSVYVLGKISGGDYELLNLQLSGASLGAWFEFCEAAGDVETDMVICAKDVKEGKKGAVTYYMPDFSVISNELSETAKQRADEADENLQEYLDEYLGGKKDEGGSTPPAKSDEPEPVETLDDCEPF